VHPLEAVQVKGRSQLVAIYKLLDLK